MSETDLEQAAQLLATGRRQQALALLAPLEHLAGPLAWRALHLLGIALRECGDPARSMQVLDRALPLAPPDRVAAIQTERAHGLLASGHVHPAIAAYRAILASPDPATTQAGTTASARFGLGLARLQSGNHAAALAELRRFTADHPAHAEGHAAHAAALSGLGRHADAIAASRRAIALTPEAPLALMNAGTVLAAAAQPEAAAELYRRAIARDPELDQAHARLAGLLATGSAPAQLPEVAPAPGTYARAPYGSAAAATGAEPGVAALHRRAQDLLATDPQQAAVLFARGAALDVPYAALCVLGLAHVRQIEGRLDEARALLLQALSRGVDAAECYARLAYVAASAQDFAAARLAAARAVAIRPGHGHAQLLFSRLATVPGTPARIASLQSLHDAAPPDQAAPLQAAIEAERSRLEELPNTAPA